MKTAVTQSSFEKLQRQTLQARTELLRRAKVLGVKPFTSLEDFAGESEMTADIDVDDFLLQVREDRDRA